MFNESVVVITGGGSGIGRATALAFGRHGARVVIGNRNASTGEETVAAIRATGGTALFVPTDVTQPVAGARPDRHNRCDVWPSRHCVQ